MTTDDEHRPPKRTGGDLGHTTVKAAISAVPFIGSPAAEFFGYLIASPLEKRREAWAESVGTALKQLTDRLAGLADRLRDDQEFLDIALQATQAAMRTSAAEKLDALRNAVLNAADTPSHDTEHQHLFVRLVDELSPQQLQFLQFFDGPRAWFEDRRAAYRSTISMGALSHVVEEAFPALKGQRSLYDQLWRNLYARGLVSTESLHVMMTGQGLFERRTTELGQRLLSFIRRSPGAG